MGKVIAINRSAPQRSLENLNRLTGLIFDEWPESLLGDRRQADVSPRRQSPQMARMARALQADAQ